MSSCIVVLRLEYQSDCTQFLCAFLRVLPCVCISGSGSMYVFAACLCVIITICVFRCRQVRILVLPYVFSGYLSARLAVRVYICVRVKF